MPRPDGLRDSALNDKKVAFALAGVAALGGALVLILFAAFPYFYAESGSARYAREHRGEALLALGGAAALLWIAWLLIRRSFALRTWAAFFGTLVGLVALGGIISSRSAPAGARPAGGNWHVVTVRQPSYEIDTIYYHLYYKRGGRYEAIQDFVAEYRFVSPDCMAYRGVGVTGGTRYAMCGYRSPVWSYQDTSATESDLLAKAASRPPYRPDWRTSP